MTENNASRTIRWKRSGPRFWAVLIFLTLPICFVATAAAQVKPGAPQRPPRQMNVRVDLVGVVTSVLDASGKPVSDLPEQSFQVYQDGRRQKIDLFQRQTDLPLDLALMIDTSLSTIEELKFEREAASRFIREVLRPGDRMAVFSFASNVEQLLSFTADASALDKALRGIRTGTGTSLFDAVYLGSHALAGRPTNRRRVLLLVTDAGETTSRATYDEARDAAVRAGAMLYTILIRPVKSESGRNTAGEHAIETIIDMTGGALYTVDEPRQFDSTFSRIDEELRTEYLLGYYPSPTPPPGSYHTIEVRLSASGAAPGTSYSLRYRKGYYTPEGGQ